MLGLDPCVAYLLANWAYLGRTRVPEELCTLTREKLESFFGTLAPHLRRPEDIPAVIELMERVYRPPHGPEAIWRPEALQEHLRHFPEGQILLKGPDGRVLADSSSVVLPESVALAPHTWSSITAGGTLANHDPGGSVFYGVDIAVDPAFQGLGLARKLYDARMALAKKLRCRWFAAGARIPGYHKVAHLMSPQAYVNDVIRGLRFDPTLSKQLKIGFRALALLPNYLRDVECCDQAVLIAKAV